MIKKKKIYLIIGLIIGVIGITSSIVIPIVLKNSKNNDNDNNKKKKINGVESIKQLISKILVKKVVIDETSGTITENKNSILTKLQSLSGYPIDLKGFTVAIKDDDTIITLQGIPFTIEISKNGQSQEITGFTVKRSLTVEEITIDEIINEFELIETKEITIDSLPGNDPSGTITENKNSILTKLQSLSGYPTDLKGFTVAIKDDDTTITLQGIPFTIEISKNGQSKKIIGFTVKRSKTIDEIINEFELIETKEITIDSLPGNDPFGTITENKSSILTKLQSLPGYPTDLKGFTVAIKDDDSIIDYRSLTPFTIEISKNDQSKEIIGFTVKRLITSQEIIVDSFFSMKTNTITIDETSGTITDNKDSILTKLQSLPGYPTDLKGFTVAIKDDDTTITLQGIQFTIEISKNGQSTEITKFKVKISS